MLEVAHFCSRVYTKIYLDVTKFLLPIFQLHNYIWNQSKKYWLQMSQLKMQSNDNNKNIANDDNHHHNNNNNNNSNTNDHSNNEITTMGQNVATLKPSSTPTTETTLTTSAVTPTTPSLIVTTTIPATELKSSSVNDVNKNPVINQSNAHNRTQKNANTNISRHSNSKSTSCVNTTSITVINPFTNVTNNVTTSSSASVINRTNNNLNVNHSDFNINRQSFTKAKCVPQATTSMVSSLSSSAMATTRADTINTMPPAMHWSQSECCHLGLSNHQAVPRPPERRVTAYERLTIDLETNPKSLRELSLGKRIGLYRIRGELGSGNFSSVKLGIHTLVKEKVAIKILDKTRLDLKTQRLLSREIEIMEQLRHPNIIRLYEVVETLAKVHLIMEYAAGGELFTKLSNEGRMTEPEAKFIFAQIISAVEHMHNNHVIHRDLKAENVFYAAPFLVKVGDFGFSTMCRTKQQALNTFCGSPPYAAPELFRDDTYYGTFVDIWALGILLYFMVTGSMPFRAENVTRMKKCILNGTYAIPMFVSDSCHFLIRGILRSLPKDRFTIEEIKNSDWLSSEAFPKPLPLYRLCPNANLCDLKEDEREAVKALGQLGITKEHFQEAINKNTRNCIIGAYRIMLHRVQKRDQEKDLYATTKFSSRLFKPRDNKKKMRTHISKLCIIL